MHCPFCGGESVKETVTFSYEGEDGYIFIEHVPADVCARCGEKSYSPEVTDELLRIARKELKPARKIEAPVYEFVMNQLSRHDWWPTMSAFRPANPPYKMKLQPHIET